MIRLIASDMDGTYIAYDGTLSKENIETVKSLNEKGIVFAAASGRNYPAVMSLFEPYGLKTEAICANGAQYIGENGKLVSAAYLSEEKRKEVTEVYKRHRVNYIYFAAEGMFSDEDPKQTAAKLEDRAVRRFGHAGMASTTTNIRLLADHPDVHIMKIEAYDMEPDVLDAVRKSMAEVEGINALSAAVDNLEVTDLRAAKGTILKEVCERKGISPDEVVVLGDGLNDISLFEEFPHSCAIGNSAQPLKDRAELIDEDDHIGFSRAIEEMLKRYNG